jgi:hypothetical protein
MTLAELVGEYDRQATTGDELWGQTAYVSQALTATLLLIFLSFTYQDP